MAVRSSIALITSATVSTIFCIAERVEDVGQLSLFQSKVEFSPRSSLAEEGEAALLQAHEDMRKAQLYSREASVLLELRDVDKQLEQKQKKEAGHSKEQLFSREANVLLELRDVDKQLEEKAKEQHDTPKAQLLNREADVLLELRDVDKQLEEKAKEDTANSRDVFDERAAQDNGDDAEQPEADFEPRKEAALDAALSSLIDAAPKAASDLKEKHASLPAALSSVVDAPRKAASDLEEKYASLPAALSSAVDAAPKAAVDPEKEAALDAALASVVDTGRAEADAAEQHDAAQESNFPEIANGEIQETIKETMTLA